MLSIIVPIILLLSIILIRKIPVIGGNIQVALLLAGLSALVLGGVHNPIDWITTWISGVNQIIWILFLVTIAGIYAESQTQLGAMGTVLNSLRSLLGHTSRGLIVAIFITLVVGGSLIGSAIATASVIGILIVKPLADIGVPPVKISAIVVMGASLGSIMPPVSQATFLSASIMGIEPDPVVRYAYLTIGIGVIFCLVVTLFAYLRKDNISLPEHLIPTESFFQIIKANWKSLVPLTILVILVALDSVPFFNIDIMGLTLNRITVGGDPFLVWLSDIPIIRGFSNKIVLFLLFATIITFLYSSIRKESNTIFKNAWKNVKNPVAIQLCAGFMIGALKVGGQIEIVEKFASGISEHMLKIGGGLSLTMMGMLTGAESTAQTTIFTFFGPSLVSIGVDEVTASVAGAHLAAAGQGLPPIDLVTFVIAGLVGGILGKKVDPVKSMLYSSVMCIYLFAVGMLFLYL